jgi:hypothetical protein
MGENISHIFIKRELITRIHKDFKNQTRANNSINKRAKEVMSHFSNEEAQKVTPCCSSPPQEQISQSAFHKVHLHKLAFPSLAAGHAPHLPAYAPWGIFYGSCWTMDNIAPQQTLPLLTSVDCAFLNHTITLGDKCSVLLGHHQRWDDLGSKPSA